MDWEYPTKPEIEEPVVSKILPKAKVSLPELNLNKEVLKEEKPKKEKLDIVWQPIPGTSQELALTCPAQEILYTGPRGPGKTICQLMRYRSRVGLGYGSYWRGIIFDLEFKNLKDLVAQSRRFFPKFEDGCKWYSSATEYKWVWPTGEELLLAHAKDEEDYDNFHGWEMPFIGFNELTKYALSNFYDKIASINRSSFDPEKDTPKDNDGNYLTHDKKPLPPIPLEFFSTTNPSGPGHNWVKERFITPAKYGQILKHKVKFYDDFNDKHVEIERTRVAIFGNFYENKYLDDTYRAKLIKECESKPHLHAAWIKGSWDVTAGGAIDDLWQSEIHILDRFPIPKDWSVDRSYDWGSSHPYASLWWAETNGEEVTLLDGNIFCPPKGSLICLYELYGAEKISVNEGVKESAYHQAKKIKNIDDELLKLGWISSKVYPGPADNQIRDKRERDVDTIEQKMIEEGVSWEKSDKSPGSRILGLQLMRDRLQATKENSEKPHIYFMRNCQACINLLPPLPRDKKKPDDVDTNSIDHIWDAVRYRVLKGANRYATQVKVNVVY